MTEKNEKINRGVLEDELKYPLFCCGSGGKSKLVAVGGGGGKSKTGVANGIALYRWCEDGIHVEQVGTYKADDCVTNVDIHPKKDNIAIIVSQQFLILDFKKDNTFVLLHQFDLIPEESNSNDSDNSSSNSSSGKGKNKKNSKQAGEKDGDADEKSVATDAAAEQDSAANNNNNNKKKPIKFEQFNLRYSPNGERLITSGADGVVRIWDTANYRLVNEYSHCHIDEINAIDTNNANTHMVTSSKDRTCKVWNLLSGRLEHTLKFEHDGKDLEFRGCRFLTGGLELVTVQFRPNTKKVKGCTHVTRWSTTTGKKEFTKQIHTMHNTCAELSNDGLSLAVATSDNLVTIVDTVSFRRLDRWEPHDFVITGLAYSPNNKSVFSASANYSVKSHQIGTGAKELDYKLIFLLALLILIVSIIYNYLIQ
ncbi:WD-40 repeat-containing protein [Heterostelium album PN500]|uniref:WD-40 repeat-containing protein n=1 Tax=Heterostelium pallidum (strain ATCC 26659 / Pp 5 / PN500) TaxID=670386 RepID=D3B8P5_HETP5|nr:WD-40 repeat-containing protein [Heterostelium album PN500]EFA82413.1 WD-40 repeat-containing protein [Heterostelium album PN500]|eukprot:XP_020434530.1 WD-40 repeat-containing protein [Heterostelium album PN500]